MEQSPAEDLIQHLRHSVLCVDADWSVECNGGFSWWPYHQRQDIFIDKRRQAHDSALERVVITTEVSTLKKEEFVTHELVGALTSMATLSGLICDDRRLRLHAHTWVDRGNQPLYDMVLGLAAGLQIKEAALIATALKQAKLGDPLVTPHPVRGFRKQPDEIASIVDTLIAPMGREKPPWPAKIFKDVHRQFFHRPPCLLANSAPDGLTAEFPFGTESSLVQANTTQTHPVVGRGLWIMNSFGVDEIQDTSCGNPLALNAWEIKSAEMPFFGSWCAPQNGLVSFVTFVPNAMKHPAAATNFILLTGGRARLVATKWLGDDWSKTWDAGGNCRSRTAIERSMSQPPQS